MLGLNLLVQLIQLHGRRLRVVLHHGGLGGFQVAYLRLVLAYYICRSKLIHALDTAQFTVKMSVLAHVARPELLLLFFLWRQFNRRYGLNNARLAMHVAVFAALDSLQVGQGEGRLEVVL